MGAVRTGLALMSWAVMAVLAWMAALVALAVGSIATSVLTERSADFITGFMQVTPFVVLGASALLFVGKVLCLKAPPEAGQSALIGSVLCSVVRAVLMFLGTRGLADVADLAGVALLMLFLGGLATHLRRVDLAERATFVMWLLVWTTAGSVMVAYAPGMIILQWAVIVWGFALLWTLLRGLDAAIGETAA